MLSGIVIKCIYILVYLQISLLLIIRPLCFSVSVIETWNKWFPSLFLKIPETTSSIKLRSMAKFYLNS